MEIFVANDACALLDDPSFIAEWTELANRCPWSTTFQRPEFVTTWHREYQPLFQPLLVVDRDAAGALVGLLPLAISQSGKIVAAGDYQAEYQAWLSTRENAGQFMPAALHLLHRHFPTAWLRLCHVPGDAPVDWAQTRQLQLHCVVRRCRRPLLRFGDGSAALKSLAKSGNKSRLRQLKKLGAIEFAKVTDPAEFNELMTEIAGFQNLRALALRGEQPFVDDPHKLPFHLAMMRTPGLLHITTLRAGGRLVSAHLNVTRGKEAQLGLISHDPLLHHYSPGKLHILLLAKMLHEEGFAQLDLTPGGESYKERYANDADEVLSLEFHPSRIRRALADARHRVREFSKRHSCLLGLSPLQARLYQHRARRLGLLHTLQWTFGQMRRQIASTQHTRIYEGAPTDAAIDSGSAITSCDRVEEIMALARQFAGPDLELFLADALGRIENGDRLLTLQSTGRLVHFAWLCDDAVGQADSHPECRRPALELPDQLMGPPMTPAALAAFVSYAAASMPGADTVQVIDSSQIEINAKEFESLGLFHTATCHSQTRFGKTRQWTQVIARPEAIPTAVVTLAAPNWRGQPASAEARQKIRMGITPNRG